MDTFSDLKVRDEDPEYGGERVWEVLDYRVSRFYSSRKRGAFVLVKFLGGERAWFAADELVVTTQLACISEFGEHEDHTDCAWILAEMSPDYPDYSRDGWYDYDAGLRWSDFVEGPIGD